MDLHDSGIVAFGLSAIPSEESGLPTPHSIEDLPKHIRVIAISVITDLEEKFLIIT
jgi:hypothetical protein